MAQYKKQHLVPQVYLKNFIKESKNENSKHKQGIYVTDKEFCGWKEKATGHGTFVKPYFYTLENEDKDNPIVEKYLSTIESKYTKTLENILSNNISKEDILFISYFTLIQQMRVEKHIETFQNTMDNLSRMVKDIHGVDIEGKTKDIAKKMLLDFGNEKESNLVFEQGIHFVENCTEEDFIISDSPAVHRMFHIDELQNIFNSIPLEYNDYLPKDKLVLFFFPLTPNIALLATKFLVLRDNSVQYIKVVDENSILQFNLLSYENAHKNIYSSTPDPFGKKLEEAIVEYNNHGKSIPYLCQIYTTKDRYTFQLDKYDSIKKDNRIMDDLKLYFTDKNNVKEMINDTYLESLVIYENGREILGKREIELGEYDDELNTLEINSKLKF